MINSSRYTPPRIIERLIVRDDDQLDVGRAQAMINSARGGTRYPVPRYRGTGVPGYPSTYSGMLPCAPRPAGAAASASANRRRVCAGVMTSST